jgi:uncharacterized protein
VLQQFAKHQGSGGSSFKAIGALSCAKLRWFNWETKKYNPACVLDEQVLLSLIGHRSQGWGAAGARARGGGTLRRYRPRGHLLEARVHPTCKLIHTESPTHLQKRLDPESGIALIQL